MPGFRITRTGSWGAARAWFTENSRTQRGNLLIAIRRAALLLEAEVKRGLASSEGMRPLSQNTVLFRTGGSDRPLLDTGAMLGSVHTTFDESKPSAFVGVHRTAHRGEVDVAAVHEFGTQPYAIPVTPALERFFLALSIASGGRMLPLRHDTAYIHHPGVPARPFLRPALERVRPLLARELAVAIRNAR